LGRNNKKQGRENVKIVQEGKERRERNSLPKPLFIFAVKEKE